MYLSRKSKDVWRKYLGGKKNAFYSALEIRSIFRFVKYFVSFVADALRYSYSSPFKAVAQIV
jgi:hypothetical protein